jgi:hypothetical protein
LHSSTAAVVPVRLTFVGDAPDLEIGARLTKWSLTKPTATSGKPTTKARLVLFNTLA